MVSAPSALARQYASAFWDDVRLDRVLPYREGKEADDEKHVHPLQLDVIERCVHLWSNPGETVLTPFMGVGSEVYGAVINGRRGIGVELKASYYRHGAPDLSIISIDILFHPLRRRQILAPCEKRHRPKVCLALLRSRPGVNRRQAHGLARAQQDVLQRQARTRAAVRLALQGLRARQKRAAVEGLGLGAVHRSSHRLGRPTAHLAARLSCVSPGSATPTPNGAGVGGSHGM